MSAETSAGWASTWYAAVLAATVPVTAALGAPDGSDIIKRLARPSPSTVPFVEARFSQLLEMPIVVSGELGYDGAESLNRHVTQPYEETTTIRGEAVRVERAGQAPRTFSLHRAPELRGLLTGMTGLLSGNDALIAAHFKVTTNSAPNDAWRIDLAPTDGKIQKRLSGITVTGAGSEPRCFVIRDTQNGASIMLLGAAAKPLPPTITLAALLGTCAAE
ncbi:MAG: LolA-related protein [Gammaproteobacteria bacterium]